VGGVTLESHKRLYKDNEVILNKRKEYEKTKLAKEIVECSFQPWPSNRNLKKSP
jgi:hypothetical protein